MHTISFNNHLNINKIKKILIFQPMFNIKEKINSNIDENINRFSFFLILDLN